MSLHDWLIRELESVPRRYRVEEWRDGEVLNRVVELMLAPF